MSIFQAVFLGLVQGLMEFLPVSSSGHLVVLQDLMGIEGEMVLFDVLLHTATLLAVAAFFHKEIIGLFKPPFKTLFYLIIATIPTIIIMFVLKYVFAEDYTETLFEGKDNVLLPFCFLITAVLLYITETVQKQQEKNTAELNAKHALVMGFTQCLAVAPGISRSGSTICAGLLAGAKKESVAVFSFLLSMPVIAGSAFVSVLDLNGGSTSIGAAPLVLGMAAAFVSGMFAIKIMLKVIQKCNYKWFSLYLIVVFAVTFINTFVVPLW